MLTDTKIAAIKPPVKGQVEHPDAKVTGLRLRVGAGGQKTWTLRKRVGAKTINRKLGTYPAMSLAKARTAALAMIEALEDTGSTETLDRTFKAAAEDWIEKKAKRKNKGWEKQERQLELHVYPAWSETRLRSIKRADVRALIEGLEGEVLPNRVLALVKTIFRYALSRDWIEASPAEAMEKPASETERDRTLDMDEVARVWNAAELLGYPYGPFVRLLLLTGQRRSEVANMRWDGLNLADAVWTFSADEAKGKRGQLVPLSPKASAIINGLPRFGPYVFSTTGETPISGFAKAKNRLDSYLAGQGDPIDDWRLHDLRRTAATHMVRLGVTEHLVGRVLNHAVQGVTGKVYALHSYAPEKRHALDLWAAAIEEMVVPN